MKESWGGSYTSYGSTYQSGANAYMLQYRKISRRPVATEALELSRSVSAGGHLCGYLLGSNFPSADLIPPYIAESIEAAEKERKTKEEALQEKLNTIVVKVTWRGKDYSISAKKTDSLRNFMFATCRAINMRPRQYEIEGKITESDPESIETIELTDDECQEICMKYARIRALSYSPPKTMTDAYHITDSNHTLQQLSFYDNKCFAFETKSASEDWPVYNASDFNFQCFEYDESSCLLKEPRDMRVPKTVTVEDVRKKIASWVSYDVSEILLVRLTENHHTHDFTAEEISLDILTLDHYYHLNNIYFAYSIYWERKVKSEEFVSIDKCMCKQALLKEKNKLVLKVDLTKMLQDPEYAATLTASDVSVDITTDKLLTVREFKESLIKTFDINPGLPFKILKWFLDTSPAYELVDMEKKMGDQNLSNNAKIFLVPGKPNKIGYLKVKVMLFTAPSSNLQLDESPVSVPAEAITLSDSEEIAVAEAVVTGTAIPPSEVVPIVDDVSVKGDSCKVDGIEIPSPSATAVDVISGDTVTPIMLDDSLISQLRAFGREKVSNKSVVNIIGGYFFNCCSPFLR